MSASVREQAGGAKQGSRHGESPECRGGVRVVRGHSTSKTGLAKRCLRNGAKNTVAGVAGRDWFGDVAHPFQRTRHATDARTLANPRRFPFRGRSGRSGPGSRLLGGRGRLPHLPHPVADRHARRGRCWPSARAARTAAATPATSTCVLRRSLDGGKTWQPMQVVWDDGATPAATRARSSIARPARSGCSLTHNLGNDTEAQILDGTSKGTRTVWVTKSTDDGATWAKPVEITKDVKKPRLDLVRHRPRRRHPDRRAAGS